jgi:uncharacterized LabA/DUF88 family protein
LWHNDVVKTILFIDGENFIYKVEASIAASGLNKNALDITHINLSKLISLALTGYKIDEINYYSAKLQYYPPTAKKSLSLIKDQRMLKTNLEKQNVNFVIAGKVVPQPIGGKSFSVVFHEKGVDVRIAVDLVALSCDKVMDTAILCSSDSDLLPAVKELRKRGITVVYVGFESYSNKALSYNCNKTILFRDSEIKQVVPLIQQPLLSTNSTP